MAVDPYIKALMEAIAYGESKGNYGIAYGNKRFSDMSKHPRIRTRISSGPNAGGYSTAAGKYQITAPTWDDYAGKVGAKDFSPANQDAVAAAIAADRYKRSTGRDLADDLRAGKVQDAAGALRSTWTSIPGGIEPNDATRGFFQRYQAALGQSPAPAAPGRFSTAPQFNAKGIHPDLIKALEQAATKGGFNTQVYSGLRPGDPRFHGKGLALDVRLLDQAGKAMPNYQASKYFPQYQQYAHQVYNQLGSINPQLAQNLRWGGYFSGGKGKYGALDLMHFDLAGNRVGMAGGSWAGGLAPQQAKLWGLQPGLPQMVAQQAAGKAVAQQAAGQAAGQAAAQMAAQQAASQTVAQQLAAQKMLATKAAPVANPFGGLLSMMMMAASKPPSKVITNTDMLPGIGGISSETIAQAPIETREMEPQGHTQKVDNRRRRIMV